MEVKTGYKLTEVGVIPEEWRAVSLGERCRVFGRIGFRGYTIDDIVEPGNGAIAIGPSNIHDGQMDFSDCTYVSFAKYEESPEIKIQNGDILLVKTGSTYGKTAIVRGLAEKATLNPQVVVLKKLRTNNLFLGYMMGFETIQSQVSRAIVGGALPTLSQALLSHFKFPEPPTEAEQCNIAEALNDADQLIGGLERLIAKKLDLKQAAMQQLLTCQIRLPGFHGEWENVRLGDLFKFKNGLNKGIEFFGYGTPIVNYMDVFGSPKMQCAKIEGRVSVTSAERKNFNVRKGDVFFTRTSETVKEIGVASVMLDDPKDTVFSGFVLRARPLNYSRLCDAFKAYCFGVAAVRKQITSKASYTTRALTNGRILSEVLLPLPSRPEQTAIAEVLTDMDAELAALERRRDKTRALKQAMIQELLTGKTRLI
jgi:type I restriction enzyme S subunit